ncbi:hypothetical protein EYF80_035285 [Liparis tanakae]|uniref:Uncharacterized protein n=1 Tax=Liparis tanakae TaxID=230148 RepID=A0A4Z2GMQ4_9TELE|nr:hypothetical protein EYF80_035285 [Liparis tanakae]
MKESICRTISANSSSTMVLLLAEVSMKGQPHSSASAWPSLDDTSRSPSRSTLLPTRITGTFSYLRTDTEPRLLKEGAISLGLHAILLECKMSLWLRTREWTARK